MNTRTHLYRLATVILPLAIALIALSFSGSGAQAQEDPPPGAELVIFDGSSGPYNVKVTQSPARAIVGTFRVIIEPTDPETGLPVENALIRVFGNPPEEGERQFSPALNSPVNRTLYFGQFELEHAGVWTFDVEIDSPIGRTVTIAQATIHERARGSGMLVGTLLFALISVGFVGGGWWLWFSSKKARKRRNDIRASGSRPRRSSG